MHRKGFNLRPGRLGEQQVSRLLDPRAQFAQLKYVPAALRLVWDAAPGQSVLYFFLLSIQGIQPGIVVLLTRVILDTLVAVYNAGVIWEVLSPQLWAFVLFGAVTLLGYLIANASRYLRLLLSEYVQRHITGLIQAKATALDLEFFESPAYFDQLQRASIDAPDRPLALLEIFGGLIQHAITLVAMLGILFTLTWWMPLLLFLGTLPALAIAFYTTFRMNEWRLKNTIRQRRMGYFNSLLTQSQSAAEIRLFQLGNYFTQSYQTLRQRVWKERLNLNRRQMVLNGAASLLNMLVVAGSLVWLILQIYQRHYSIGDLAVFYQAINQGSRLMSSLMSGFADIYNNLVFLEDFFSFLRQEKHLKDPETPADLAPGLKKGIDVRSVTFRYPGSERVALNHFNLHLPAGKIVAIVGENGAGKSTLLKLLCRFYDPEEGTLQWDGVDLRNIRQDELRRRITVLFQQPVSYYDTVFNNIAFGNLQSNPTPEDVRQAAIQSGAEPVVQKLKDGYETMLGKWFGFAELSVGEWQRLALARAFVRQADLIILDEPTSAMDAWAEMEWLKRFRSLAAGRTALMITHRFTTAMQADQIHVMADGQIIESGTHQELVDLGGRYAASWNEQMRQARLQ